MTTFGWKRKIGENVSKSASTAFNANVADDDDEALDGDEVDWLHLVPKRRAVQLEDGVCKAKRLREEGAILAGQERYWEALQKWDDALLYNPSDEAIHEMRAQAYMQVGEVLPAIQAASKSVFHNPRWWVGHQTLGRAYLGVGEVKKALRSFCKAVHLNPVSEDLWEEDVRWTLSLCLRSSAARKAKERLMEEANMARVVELDEDGFCKDVVTAAGVSAVRTTSMVTTIPGTSALTAPARTSIGCVGDQSITGQTARRKPPRKGTSLPPNYVCLRE